MKKLNVIKKVTIILLTIVITALIMSGCAFMPGHMAGNGQELNEAIVLGIHKNFRSIPVQIIEKDLYECAYSYGSMAVVISQGSPCVSENFILTAPEADINNAKRKQIASENTDDMLRTIASLKAINAEVDTIRSISIAAKALESSTKKGSRKLTIIDNGLSTAGLINMAEENVVEIPPESLIEQLAALHALPKLDGVEVVWYGLGQTAGTQTELSDSYAYKLETIWQSVLEASGASVSFRNDQLPTNEPECDLPYVSAVPVTVDKLDFKAGKPADIIKFTDASSVAFKGDLAELVNESAAIKELSPIAQYLVSSGESVYIAGMTATHGDAEQRKRLSRDRCDTIKKLLVSMGVPSEKIISAGLGYAPNPLRAKDTDENGRLIEEKARLNRAVFLFSSSSPYVETIVLPNL